MDNKNSELKKRIENLSNEELIEMLEVNYNDYREEAIQIAKCVATDRGIELIKKSIPDYIEQNDQIEASQFGFFNFNWMISTYLLQFLYVVGLIVITVVSIYLIVNGVEQEQCFSIGLGAVLLIFGNILWRILCELWILFFSIHDLICEIAIKLRRKLG